jgi:two-component system chemotaxis response regulator CheB
MRWPKPFAMHASSEPKFFVVVGASAGGLQSVIELVAQLKESMSLAVFVVLHLSKMSLSDVLVTRLQAMTPFTCKLAEDGEPARAGYVYLAPPDVHLLVSNDDGRPIVKLGHGASENRWRPSIDILFRSAAAVCNSRVIGIILSGLMQDGTVGMESIKRSGGTLMVQDPEEAEYPDMILSVLQNMEVDYTVSLAKMGLVLEEKCRDEIPPERAVPKDVAAEAALSERVATSIEDLEGLGPKSAFSCPDCGGGLYYTNAGTVTHYRCHVGHSYTEGDLLFQMTKHLEGTLWTALRMMEERRLLLKRMAEEEVGKGWIHSAAQKRIREGEMRTHIERLKELLFASQPAAKTG